MMKTAKEILQEHNIDFYKNRYDAIVEAIRQYAAAACKEQREICAKQYECDRHDINIILNAPQPQLL